MSAFLVSSLLKDAVDARMLYRAVLRYELVVVHAQQGKGLKRIALALVLTVILYDLVMWWTFAKRVFGKGYGR